MSWFEDAESWRFILCAYLPRLTIVSLFWEIVQLPLYRLWQNSQPEEIAIALAHCTAGDALIGVLALISGLILVRARHRSEWPVRQIVAVMIGLTMTYTVYSEKINLALGNWAYAATMPIVPWLEVGLAPVLQWLLVPLATWWWTNQSMPSSKASDS